MRTEPRKVAIVADSHFDERSRFDECVRVHCWIADGIEIRQPDLMIHTGDMFERKSTPEERIAAAAWIQRIADTCPVVIVRGNHDVERDLALFARLETRHGVTVVEGASVVVRGGVAVACLAWPSKASVLQFARARSILEGELVAADALRDVLRGLGDQLAEHDSPRVLAAHAMVRGSVTSVGQPLVGCDLEIGLDDLGLARADLVALGHIHKGQHWQHGTTPIVYPGSPRRTAYGETEPKGYVLAEIERGRATWQLVETPCSPMVLAENTWTGDDWLGPWDDAINTRGAEVRLRYTVEADRRDAARASALTLRDVLMSRGARDVKVDEQVAASVRARAPEVAKARTLADKLGAYWRARDEVPEPPRAKRLLGKVAEIEADDTREAS